jgi:hypothetical protein
MQRREECDREEGKKGRKERRGGRKEGEERKKGRKEERENRREGE